MLSAFINSFKIPELRQRIFFTLGVIALVRFGAAIPAPGVDASILAHYFEQVNNQTSSSVVALFNIFSGGALEACAVFSLGIMPYISASIIIQLLTAVYPRLAKTAREEGGRAKITQYTRYLTLILCLFQGTLLAHGFANPKSNPFLPGIDATIQQYGPLVANPDFFFYFSCIMTLTAGTMLLMWFGEQITDKGIGQGISVIITIGILARLPAAITQSYHFFSDKFNPVIIAILLLFLFGVIAGIVAVTSAERKIPVQFAKRMVGRKLYGGQTTFMPLKVNYAGVMPIIFAQAILMFPQTFLMIPGLQKLPGFQELMGMLNPGTVLHVLLYGIMIFFFSYFWVSTQFNPTQIADDLKKNSGYIPGVRPGKPTADFLDFTMTRLTLAGAAFLTIIAILPEMVNYNLKVSFLVAQFFGGTSLLICVGVVLDTMRQVETFLLQRHYDGFLKKGRLRSRQS
ncbi:MAG: preprotein translocase subunit SecY [Verrucomicrobiota bacterium]|nr:preprotein translocase subunit SecY [Verrucomicrobiota bacterium]